MFYSDEEDIDVKPSTSRKTAKKKAPKKSVKEEKIKVEEEPLFDKPSKLRQSKKTSSKVLKSSNNVVKTELLLSGTDIPSRSNGSRTSLGAGPSKLLRTVLSSEIINHKITARDRIDAVSSTVINNLSFHTLFSPFANRKTCIRWQPKRPSSLLVGGKGGELSYIPDVNTVGMFDNQIDENCKLLSPGVGPGGEIRELQFDEADNNQFYSLNVSGNLIKVNIERSETTEIQPYQDTTTTWYGGFCVHFPKRLIFVGDTEGSVHLLPDSTRGGEGKCHIMKCHKKKISHINFHPKDENLMVTCDSGERCVKVWDIRITRPFKFVAELLHDRPPNSCYFNADGSMALTTDQLNDLRVYSVVNWKIMRTIRHPHRHYQHITPIRAEWHPLADIIHVGRYPDDNFKKDDKKTVDFYDYRDGREIRRIEAPNKKICLLNRFNQTGDTLASLQMMDVLIFRQGSHKITSKSQTDTRQSSSSGDDGDSDIDKKKLKGKSKVRRLPPRKTTKTTKAVSKSNDDIDKIKARSKLVSTKAGKTSTGSVRGKTKRAKKKESSEELSSESEEEVPISKSKRKRTRK